MTKNRESQTPNYKYGVIYCDDGFVGNCDTPEEAIQAAESEYDFNPDDESSVSYFEFIRYEVGKFVPPSSPATVLFEGE